MNNMFSLSVAIFATAWLLMSCGNASPANEIWIREIYDEELNVTGVEEIEFDGESSVEIRNSLCLKYSDSTVVCKLAFSTSVRGRCMLEGCSLELYLDSSSFRCDTVPGEFFIETSGTVKRNVAVQLRNQLFQALRSYYYDMYAEVEQNNPLVISDIAVSDDGIISGINSGRILNWRSNRGKTATNSDPN